MVNDERYRSSIHEVGHLVVAKLLKLDFDNIEYAAELPIGGRPVTYIQDINYEVLNRLDAIKYIAAIFAAKHAEEEFFGDYYSPGLKHDEDEIVKLVKHICLSDTNGKLLEANISKSVKNTFHNYVKYLEIMGNNLYFNGHISHCIADGILQYMSNDLLNEISCLAVIVE